MQYNTDRFTWRTEYHYSCSFEIEWTVNRFTLFTRFCVNPPRMPCRVYVYCFCSFRGIQLKYILLFRTPRAKYQKRLFTTERDYRKCRCVARCTSITKYIICLPAIIMVLRLESRSHKTTVTRNSFIVIPMTLLVPLFAKQLI